jgi:signal transduction histidine kinase
MASNGPPPASTTSRSLLLPPILEAVEAWRSEPGDEQTRALGARITELAGLLGLTVRAVRVTAPPLPDLDLDLGPGVPGVPDGELAFRAPDLHEPFGSLRLAGDVEQAAALAHALELVFVAARAQARADRTARQLLALDQAVRGIGGVLDVDRVLQVIVDRVRELVDAQYAAIGIVDRDGAIERFITSGISDHDRSAIGDLPHGRGLLGLIIRENRTYRIPDIASHPESYGFPPHHPAMGSFLGMPITARGEVVGRLYLTNKLGASEFSTDDQALVEMFALHAGIAIENARLHDQVRRLAVVDERDRISRDLHDSVIQSIYAQTLALEDVPDLMAAEPDEARRRVDEAIDALHAVIRDIRNFIFGLRPVLLEAGTLATGLAQLATELHRNGAVAVAVEVDDPDERVAELPIETVAELLAISREALSNIARHAAASRATVALALIGGDVRLEIGDDGRGFDADRQAGSGHHGLANMRARSSALGAAFSVTSGADGGTRIIVVLPAAGGADGGPHDR